TLFAGLGFSLVALRMPRRKKWVARAVCLHRSAPCRPYPWRESRCCLPSRRRLVPCATQKLHLLSAVVIGRTTSGSRVASRVAVNPVRGVTHEVDRVAQTQFVLDVFAVRLDGLQAQFQFGG